MTQMIAQPWEAKRTDQTRQVEEALKKDGFAESDAYRYNSASIRVRVIDSRFEGLSIAERDAMVEPAIEMLPEATQADIISLFTFAPSELSQPKSRSRPFLLNLEFEDPSPSML